MVKAALLDVDGTLFDTERLFMEGWKRAGKVKGYPLTDEQIIAFHGRGQQRNGVAFCEWFGEDADYWGTRALRLEYVEQEIAKHGVPLKTGLFEFLKFLKANGITVVLATGTVRSEAEPRWQKAGIMDYVDASVCGDEVTLNKPHPEIFQKAAALANADPADCIVFEDSDNGLRAAKAAGAFVVMVPDLDPVTDDLRKDVVDRICPTLLDAVEMMKETFDLNG